MRVKMAERRARRENIGEGYIRRPRVSSIGRREIMARNVKPQAEGTVLSALYLKRRWRMRTDGNEYEGVGQPVDEFAAPVEAKVGRRAVTAIVDTPAPDTKLDASTGIGVEEVEFMNDGGGDARKETVRWSVRPALW
jgi:hypothetical protein